MKFHVIALKALALCALACCAYGIVCDKPAYKWGGWIAYFPPAEALGCLGFGATFSGFEWALRRSNKMYQRVLGSAIVGLFLWCGSYHFVVFRDWTKRKWRWGVDSVILGIGIVTSYASAHFAEEKENNETH